MFFTTRAKLFVLFTFASFLAGNVKSDSASGCCASWYGGGTINPVQIAPALLLMKTILLVETAYNRG